MPSKYRSRKTERDGIVFASAAEAHRYGELKLLEASGAISDLVLQPAFELQPRFKHGKRTIRPIIYLADFSYIEMATGRRITEDVKGFSTPAFQIKAKLLMYKFPDVELRLIK